MTTLKWRRALPAAAILAVLWAGVLPAADEPPKADFHVATDGNDKWSRRLAAPNADKTDGPFATLTAARNALRKINKTKSMTVLVRGGTYRLTETFVLKPVDGGERRTEGANQPAEVTYAAYPGETPVISGGRVISERFSNKPGSEVWSVHLPKGVGVSDLYVAGKRMTRARMPNEGFWSAEPKDATKTTFRYKEGLFGEVPDAASGFAVVRPYQWCEFHLPIKDIDAAARTVTLAAACGYVVSPGGYGAPGHFRIENVAAAMDAPGEWVFNPDSGVLHLIPPAGGADPNKVEVVAAGLPILLSLEGPPKGGTPVQYVNFVGLTFTHTGRNPKPEWGAYAACAVRVAGSVRFCHLARCRFVDLGAVGVTMWKGSCGNAVVGSEFAGTGETAVVIVDHLDQPRPRTAFNVISDCEIHHCGVVNAGAKAIEISMNEDNTIAQNHIHDMP